MLKMSIIPFNLSNETIHQKDGLANFGMNFDVEIQRFLISKCKEVLLEASFFGEEDTEGNDNSTDDYCFCIDPIDGTANFLFGYQHSCIPGWFVMVLIVWIFMKDANNYTKNDKKDTEKSKVLEVSKKIENEYKEIYRMIRSI